MNRYALAGLAWLSDLALPELPRASAAGAPDVRVRRHAIPALPAGQLVQADECECRIEVPEIARFAVVAGREIRVEPLADAASVRAFLLNAAVRALCLQRGWLPLRGAAIATDGGAVVLCGAAGRGKSTLAAAMEARGHAVLADDTAIVACDGGAPLVLPGVPRLVLWGDALRALALPASGLVRVRPGLDRFLRPVPAARPSPLSRVYVLERPALAPGLERLPAIAAAQALALCTASRALLPGMGTEAGHMARVMATLGAGVEVWRLRMRNDVAADAEVLEAALAGRNP
ncbi:MAG: hypothetical protein KJ067_17160 [Vicinamibacteria bacterium]|nr:hypothetical protein [Vicinamibacteria bacterium]